MRQDASGTFEASGQVQTGQGLRVKGWSMEVMVSHGQGMCDLRGQVRGVSVKLKSTMPLKVLFLVRTKLTLLQALIIRGRMSMNMMANTS